MTSPIQPNKTYGVLHTESFFSFLGFAKKIGSDEPQKIDVYLDNKLIDTIEANEFIQKIDDMYDVENQAFTYNLPNEYIGGKATISFKNHNSGEELLNSPYTLIDKNHEKFNEAKFINSLNEPISEELKSMYKPNSIGFLATKENLEDVEFVRHIKELMKRFPEFEFNGFCFDEEQTKNLKNTFKVSKNTFFITISTIGDILKNCLIWISSNNNISLEIRKKINFSIFINFEVKNLSIQEYEFKYKNSFNRFYKNPQKFGVDGNDSFFGDAYNKLIQSFEKNFILDINSNYFEFSSFKQVELALKYKEFIPAIKNLSSLLND
ncbi:hypothetical protein [Aliarcobacter lanthieri]|uniref:hypothetical protein n=1 Tax=Aliarcobacter lanthieri TaxID=1355374 RepID=UPI00047D8989|nr:hypothetical protein [Aliarcobacter lanthieri]QKF60175.1 hypothetical protein ALANTH_2108 [Aliarcobacter lanthieri]